MIRFFITRILAWAAKVSWTQFMTIVASAALAAQKFPRRENMTKEDRAAVNIQRAQFVSDAISATLTTIPTWAVNLLRELAVAYLNRGGKPS
jgi:hypothetical protein